MAYTQKELYDVYQELWYSRPHICTGCGGKAQLSPSHIIPRSRRSDLVTNKDNITFHCLSIGDRVGCHNKHESMEVVTLNDFRENMIVVHRLDPEYFWLRMHKLLDHWMNRDRKRWLMIRNLMDELDKATRVAREQGERYKFLEQNGML